MRSLILVPALLLVGCDQLGPRSPEVGRYRIVHSPHLQRDTMLLDTVTGKTWQLVKRGPNEERDGLGWQLVEKIEPQKSDLQYPDEFGENVTWSDGGTNESANSSK